MRWRAVTVRVIDHLRKTTGIAWTWDKHASQWNGSDGSHVSRCAALAPRYDGDDDTFRTEYWRYFSDGRIPEQVYL